MDKDIHGIAFDFLAPAVDPFLDARSRQDCARLLDERVHQCKFTSGQHDSRAAIGDLVTFKVERDLSSDQEGPCGASMTSAIES